MSFWNFFFVYLHCCHLTDKCIFLNLHLLDFSKKTEIFSIKFRYHVLFCLFAVALEKKHDWRFCNGSLPLTFKCPWKINCELWGYLPLSSDLFPYQGCQSLLPIYSVHVQFLLPLTHFLSATLTVELCATEQCSRWNVLKCALQRKERLASLTPSLISDGDMIHISPVHFKHYSCQTSKHMKWIIRESWQEFFQWTQILVFGVIN